MMTITRLLVLCVGCLMLGCVPGTVMDTHVFRPEASYPPTDPEQVEVLDSAPRDREYIEIGKITARNINWPAIERAFQREGAKMGGDAVYVSEQTGMQPQSAYRERELSASPIRPLDARIVKGTVIRYR
ncbi:MAG: hypothetical protein GF333_03955 [Candidatus Omnitrophica bacterium]|nr:hypothetical protein [Candidatus Omnitrophota bacterium]